MDRATAVVVADRRWLWQIDSHNQHVVAVEMPTEHMEPPAMLILTNHEAARTSSIMGRGLQCLSREKSRLDIVNADLFGSSFSLGVLRERTSVLTYSALSHV